MSIILPIPAPKIALSTVIRNYLQSTTYNLDNLNLYTLRAKFIIDHSKISKHGIVRGGGLEGGTHMKGQCPVIKTTPFFRISPLPKAHFRPNFRISLKLHLFTPYFCQKNVQTRHPYIFSDTQW